MYKTASKHTPRGYYAGKHAAKDLVGPYRVPRRPHGGVTIVGGTSHVCPECSQQFTGLKAFRAHLLARHPVRCFDLLSDKQKKRIRRARYNRLKRQKRKRKTPNQSLQPTAGRSDV